MCVNADATRINPFGRPSPRHKQVLERLTRLAAPLPAVGPEQPPRQWNDDDEEDGEYQALTAELEWIRQYVDCH